MRSLASSDIRVCNQPLKCSLGVGEGLVIIDLIASLRIAGLKTRLDFPLNALSNASAMVMHMPPIASNSEAKWESPTPL